jgi:hypothetical protein
MVKMALRQSGFEIQRQEREGADMAWSNDAEIPAVDRRDLCDAQPLRCGYDRGVDRPKRQVFILLDKLAYPRPVLVGHRLDRELIFPDVVEEVLLCDGT